MEKREKLLWIFLLATFLIRNKISDAIQNFLLTQSIIKFDDRPQNEGSKIFILSKNFFPIKFWIKKNTIFCWPNPSTPISAKLQWRTMRNHQQFPAKSVPTWAPTSVHSLHTNDCRRRSASGKSRKGRSASGRRRSRISTFAGGESIFYMLYYISIPSKKFLLKIFCDLR